MARVRSERIALGIRRAPPQVDRLGVLASDQQVARARNVDGFDRKAVLQQREREKVRKESEQARNDTKIVDFCLERGLKLKREKQTGGRPTSTHFALFSVSLNLYSIAPADCKPHPFQYLIGPKDAVHRPAKLARARRPLHILDGGRILARRPLERRRDLVEEQLVAEADRGDEAPVGRPVLRRREGREGRKSQASEE